jgi:hypothetical protein
MMAMFRRLRLFGALAFLLLPVTGVCADSGRFDLIGPKIDVHVTRAGKTLPIAQVPNLLPGDKLWLHPDLPATQSVRYLLVAVFLRGTTNPPPDKWFYRIETWDKNVMEEGVTITVPNEAQQAILFLAPETGGDFSTLRSAVRGRPGVFVRASQDLIEAGFEQARIEKYLASMRFVPPGDPKALLAHSDLLAGTLNLKPNEDCFKQPVDLQYTCLTQSGNQTLLDDGHAQSMVASLASGSSADFIASASYTQIGGGGVYSAYVGTVIDLVRLMSGLHTAHYQYIPAIAFPDGDSLNLRLNTPPSFANPKSVIVIGLPAIKAATPPPLRERDPDYISCLLKPSVVLPIEGAPLVFSTSFAHDLVLHINGPGDGTDIQVTPNAYQGGLVLAPVPLRKILPLPSDLDNPASSTSSPASQSASAAASSATKPAPTTNMVTGTIKGYWGFDKFTGPTLNLQEVPGQGWKLAQDDVLIADRENHLTLSSTGTACISSIALDTASGGHVETKWKQTDKPASVNVTIPLKSVDPGTMHLAIHQYGDLKPDTVAAQTFSEPARLDSLELHAGDNTATLVGTSLDQVKQLAFGGLIFTPAPAPTDSDTASDAPKFNSLRLSLPPDSPTPKFHEGEKITARFTLNDGRTLTLPVTVAAPRPSVVLLSKRIESPADATIHLADQNDLPINQQLTFSLKSSEPFSRKGQIEIANADGSLHTTLSVAAGTLVLQNPHTLLATLDPLKSFGTSAFGPLRLRAVAPDGTTGDWLPLATLVRLPDLKEVRCTSDVSVPCTLDGDNLYLVDSIAADPAFSAPTTVPEGFIGTTLALARPTKTGFYLRLRDDPAAANIVTLPVTIQRTAPAVQRASQAAQPKPAADAPNELSPPPAAEAPEPKSISPSAPTQQSAHQPACLPPACTSTKQ